MLALTRYERRGSTSRLRLHQYLPWLERAGIDVTLAPLWKDAYLERLYAGRRPLLTMVLARYAERLRTLLGAARFDVVWLEAEALPYLPAVAERALARAGIPLVVDYDDAVFHKYGDHPRRGVRLALGGKIDSVMRASALVVAGNEYIAGRAALVGAARVEVIPTVVDIARYQVTGPPSHQRPPRVVWIGTSGTAQYLRAVERPLQELCEQGVLQVRLVGAGSPALAFPFQSVPWSEDTEVSLLQEADIGIMPLPDLPFERGKCGYKLLQYMACGLPTVASPVGANVDIVEQGESGFLVSSPREWEESLRRLAIDSQLRARLGGRGRAIVEECYALHRTAPRLTSLLVSASQWKRGGRALDEA